MYIHTKEDVWLGQCILLRFLLSLCRLWPQLSVRLFFFLSLSLRFNRGSQRNLSSIILLRSTKTFKSGSRRSKSSYLFLVFSWSTLLTIGLRWLLPWTRLTSCANVVSNRRWGNTRSPLWYVLNFLSLNGEWEGVMITWIHKASVGRNWATIFLDENFLSSVRITFDTCNRRNARWWRRRNMSRQWLVKPLTMNTATTTTTMQKETTATLSKQRLSSSPQLNLRLLVVERWPNELRLV